MTSDEAGILRIERELEGLKRQFELDQALLAEVHERRRSKLLQERRGLETKGNSSRNPGPRALGSESPAAPLCANDGPPGAEGQGAAIPDDPNGSSPVAVATPPAQALPLGAAVPGSPRQGSAEEQGSVPGDAQDEAEDAAEAAPGAAAPGTAAAAGTAAAGAAAQASFGLTEEERAALTFHFARGPNPGARFQRALRGRKLPGSLWEKLGLSKSSSEAPVVPEQQQEEENGTTRPEGGNNGGPGFVVTSLEPHEVDSFEGLHVSMWEQALRELEDEGVVSERARRVQRVFTRPPGAPIPEEEQSAIGGGGGSGTSSSDDEEEEEFGEGVAAGGAEEEDEQDEIFPPWREAEDDYVEEVSGDGNKAATEDPEAGEVVISGGAATDPAEEEEKLRDMRREEHAKLEKAWQAALEAVGADSSAGAAKLRAVRQLCALRPSPPGAREAEAADFCDVPVNVNLKLALRQEVKMAWAMAAVAEQLLRLVNKWRDSKAPREEARAWKAWHKMAKTPSVVQEWRARAEEKVERVLKLGDEVARSNLDRRSPSMLAKPCSSLEPTLFELMRLRFFLEVATRPVPPPKPAIKRKAPAGAAKEAGAEAPVAMEVDGEEEEEGSEYEADSFIVDDDEVEEEGEQGPGEEDAVDGPAPPDDAEGSMDAEDGGLLLPGQLRAGQTMMLVSGKKRARAEEDGGSEARGSEGAPEEEPGEQGEPVSKAAKGPSEQPGQGDTPSPQGGDAGPSTEAAAAAASQQQQDAVVANDSAMGGAPGGEPQEEDGGVPAAEGAPDEVPSTEDAEEDDEIEEIQLNETAMLEEEESDGEGEMEEEEQEEAMVYGKGSLEVGHKAEVAKAYIWEAGLVLQSLSNGKAVLRPEGDEADEAVQPKEAQEFMVRPAPPPYSVTNDAIKRYRIMEVFNSDDKAWVTCVVADVLGTLSVANASRYQPEAPEEPSDRDPFMDGLYERGQAAAQQTHTRVVSRVLRFKSKAYKGGGTSPHPDAPRPLTNFDISMGDLRIPMQWNPSTGEWTDKERSQEWQEGVTEAARPKKWSKVLDKACHKRLQKAGNVASKTREDKEAKIEALKAGFMRRQARNPFVNYTKSRDFFSHNKNPVAPKQNVTRGGSLPDEPETVRNEAAALSASKPRASGFLRRQGPPGASSGPSAPQPDKRLTERDRHFNKYIEVAKSRRDRASDLRQRGREMAIAIAHLTPVKAMSHQDSEPLFEGEEEPRILRKISSCLKDYQWGGIRFMWDNLVREHDAAALQEEEGDGEDIIGGCILAHSMGLGKTLQTIAFLSTFHSSRSPAYSIVVVPANVLVNWAKEFDQWLGKAWLKVLVVHNASKGHKIIEQWSKMEEGAVLLITYNILAGYVLPASAKSGRPRKTPTSSTEAANQTAQTSELLRLKPDVVVADEAHELRNEKSKKTKAMMKFSTKRRAALTGYPLQNNLKEYWVMMQWTREGILPPLDGFTEDFCQPINEGQFSNDAGKRNHMLDMLSVLDDLCNTMRQRKGPEVLLEELKRAGASKKEHVLLFQLSPLQEELYNAYLEGLTKDDGSSRMTHLAVLNQIINCPRLFIETIRGSEAGGVWEQDNVCNLLISSDEEDAKSDKAPKQAQISTAIMQRMRDIIEAAQPQGQSDVDCGNNPKMAALESLVESCRKADEKLVVFTESTRVLGDMERHLVARGWRKARDGDREFRPEPRTYYFMRLEGSTSSAKRQAGVKRFNEQGNSVLVYLMSTKAGSLGINLTSAFRMVIWDCPWNPCHNAQAVARIFRIGQTQRCFVYRMLYENTTEHHIYHRTLGKESLFSTVVDNKTTISQMNKAELYKREPPQPRDADLRQQIADKQDPMLSEISEACNALLRVQDHQELLAPDMDYQVYKIDRKKAARSYMLRSADKEEQTQPGVIPDAAAPGSASKKPKKTSGKLRWRRLRKIRELEEGGQEQQQQQPPVVPDPPPFVPGEEQQQQHVQVAAAGDREPSTSTPAPVGLGGGASGSAAAADGSSAAASTALIDEAGISDISKEQPQPSKPDVAAANAAPPGAAAAANGASSDDAPGAAGGGAGGGGGGDQPPPPNAASSPPPPAPPAADDDGIIDLCDSD